MLKEKEALGLKYHYDKFLGDMEELNYTSSSSGSINLKFLLSRANKDRNYHIISTIGLSGIKSSGIYPYSELMIMLDSNWKFKMDNPNYNWPFELLNKIAYAIAYNDIHIKYGQYFANDKNRPFSALTDMGVALVALPYMLNNKFFELKNFKKRVNFFLITTATLEELRLIKNIGGINFIQRYLLPEGESSFVLHNKKI